MLASRCLTFEMVSQECCDLCEGAGSDTKSPFDNARFATHVACEVESRRLSFAERPHDFETLDRRIGRFQRLEAPDRSVFNFIQSDEA